MLKQDKRLAQQSVVLLEQATIKLVGTREANSAAADPEPHLSAHSHWTKEAQPDNSMPAESCQKLHKTAASRVSAAHL